MTHRVIVPMQYYIHTYVYIRMFNLIKKRITNETKNLLVL